MKIVTLLQILSLKNLWNLISRKFRLMDTSGDRKLTFDEFVEGCQRVVARMSKEELKTVFDAFDKDGNGYMNYDEFLAAVRVSA